MAATNRSLDNPQQDGRARAAVWDVLVRFGHWLMVVLFFAAYFTEDDLLALHSWAGYAIALYIAVRIVWGFIGSKHARFSDFLYGPKRALAYLMDLVRFRARRYIGHSPAGAVMVFALLICLVATTATGIALLAVRNNAGPLAPWLGRPAALETAVPGSALGAASPVGGVVARQDDEGARRRARRARVRPWKEVHEFFANLTLILILLHVAGVGLASLAHRENLVLAMITGRKRAGEGHN